MQRLARPKLLLALGRDHGQWHLMAGKPYVKWLATGLTKLKQRVLGMDVSGVVEAVGAEVGRFKVGDAVFGASSRTFADFTCAREDQLCLKPERLSLEQAAGASKPARRAAAQGRSPAIANDC